MYKTPSPGNSIFALIIVNKLSSIQLKATILLIIFSLNIVTGFACAIGMDMKFNTGHHKEETTEVHVHTDGTKHHHENTPHKHKDSETNCCTDAVVKISQTDKAVPQAAKLLSPLFFTTFVATYYNIYIACTSQVTAFHKYFLRGHHPPIPDIRIAIQSFQI